MNTKYYYLHYIKDTLLQVNQSLMYYYYHIIKNLRVDVMTPQEHILSNPFVYIIQPTTTTTFFVIVTKVVNSSQELVDSLHKEFIQLFIIYIYTFEVNIRVTVAYWLHVPYTIKYILKETNIIFKEIIVLISLAHFPTTDIFSCSATCRFSTFVYCSLCNI